MTDDHRRFDKYDPTLAYMHGEATQKTREVLIGLTVIVVLAIAASTLLLI